MIEKCKQCGDDFEITEDDIKYYKSKNYDLPKRCKKCREENRKDKSSSNGNSNRNSNGTTGSNKKGSKKTIGGTAVAVCVALYLVFTGQDLGVLNGDNNINNDNQTTNQSSSNESSQDFDLSAIAEEDYYFRNDDTWESHFEKHKSEFEYANADEYLEGANRVIDDPNALRKTEKEDGDYLFYLEETNEYVVLSTDGYIRTYFEPSAGLDYFNRQ
ncbi:MAG: zinc-ribbon domain containing protein [Lachnospirales bacterium]